jgi:integrase
MDEPKVWLRRRTGKGKIKHDLRWIVKGKTRSRYVGTDGKLAERKGLKLEEELSTGDYRDVRRIRWEPFVTDHVGKIAGTVNRADAERTLRMFDEVCGPIGPHDVTYASVERFVASLQNKGNSTATVNKRLRYLRVALNKAVRRGHIARNPMEGWKWEREEQKVPRALADDEKAKLLKVCPTEQWRTFVFVALTTGCRRGELLGLEWSRVDFDNARLLVTGTKAKRDRLQPLSPEAVVMLRGIQASTLKDGGPFRSMTPSGSCHAFQAIVKAAGIAPCVIHDLRRTFCTDLARAGVNALVMQHLAGHAAMQTTAKFYTAVDDSMKRDAIRRLGKQTA